MGDQEMIERANDELSMKVNIDRAGIDSLLEKVDRINKLCEEVSSLLEELTSTDLVIPVAVCPVDSE